MTCNGCRYSTGMCRCDRFAAYVGAKFADEPVKADFHQSYPSREDAQRGVADAKRGGFGFVHDTVTDEWFGNRGCGDWRVLPPMAQVAEKGL